MLFCDEPLGWQTPLVHQVCIYQMLALKQLKENDDGEAKQKDKHITAWLELCIATSHV